MSESTLPLFAVLQTPQDSRKSEPAPKPTPKPEPYPGASDGASDGVVDIDFFALRAILYNIGQCRTVIGRDTILQSKKAKIEEIIGKRPDLLCRWLLGLDAVNRRFSIEHRSGR